MADGIKKINEWLLKDGRTLNVTRNIDSNKLEGGTQFINYNTGLLQYVGLTSTGAKEWKNYDPMIIFLPQSIKTNLIADKNVTTAKINDLGVTTIKLDNSAVTEPKLATNSVTETKILNSSVTRNKVADGAINDIKLAENSVTEPKILNGSVTADKIAALTIIDNNIADNTITNKKFFNKTLENTKIKDKTLIETLYADKSVSTRALADVSVTEVKVALNAITTTKVKDRSITGPKIALNAIATEHVDSIDGGKLIDNSITEPKYKSLSVSTRALANASINMDKLNANVADLINRSIRVEKSQTIDNVVYADTAWCRGHMILKQPASGNANLTVHGNITATGTVTATKCYNPVFADLAEAYIPLEEVKPGEPVALSKFGGLKVEKLDSHNQDRFIGFVSDEFATCYGATEEELKSGKKIPVTLVGRIQIKAKGEEANVGDYVYIVDGRVRLQPGRSHAAVGRVLEPKCKNQDTVLCQLWP